MYALNSPHIVDVVVDVLVSLANSFMQKENAKLLSDNRKQLKLKTSSGRVNREKVSKIVLQLT